MSLDADNKQHVQGEVSPAALDAMPEAPAGRRERESLRQREAGRWINVDYARRRIVHLPPWGGLTVADVLLNNLALGLFLATVFCVLLRPEQFLPAAFPAFVAAWVMLMADLGLLILDLGDPFRFHHMLRTVRPSSPMWVGVWALALSGFFLTFPALWGGLLLLLRAEMLPDSLTASLSALAAAGIVKWAVVGATLAGVPCAAVGLLYKGVLFSATSRPIWKNARWFPAYLTNGALLLGTALLAVFGTAVGPMAGTYPLLYALLVLLVPDMLLLELHLRPLLKNSRSLLMHLATLLDAAAFLCLLGAGLSLVPGADILLMYCGVAGILSSAIVARACFVKTV